MPAIMGNTWHKVAGMARSNRGISIMLVVYGWWIAEFE